MSGIAFRHNPDKANTSEISTTSWNDIDDTIALCKGCYRSFGCIGVALLTIAAVGAAYYLGGTGSSSAKDCMEWCSYDSNGFGTCFQFFCGK